MQFFMALNSKNSIFELSYYILKTSNIIIIQQLYLKLKKYWEASLNLIKK